ncbi:hypothetical protein GCM10027347_17230 [Larkinella harenae]
MSLVNKLLESPTHISFLSGASNYSWLYFIDGKKELISKPLSFFESRLSQFVRIHKTALINPRYVIDWQAPPRSKMAGSVRMRCGMVLPVGRRRWPQIVGLLPKANAETDVLSEVKIDRAVVFVSDSQTRATWVQQSFEGEYSDCLVNHLNRGRLLPTILHQIPDTELPALILLDACSSVADRLSTLQLLKETPRTASIPTLLLISGQAPEALELAYAGHANSVIPVSEDYAAFTKTIHQLGKFWFHRAALPARA